MQSILENKAISIMNALIVSGVIEVEPSQSIKNIILDALESGGNFQLQESEDGISVKTIARNEAGEILGKQG